MVASGGCATIQEPPGGPPDTKPPTIVAIVPDSGAVVPGWRQPVVIRFDEVIDERSGGSLDKLVTLSPVPKALSVAWRRTAIAIQPKEGWRAGTVYQVTLLPGVQDLRNNRLLTGRTIVFSTGGPIPTTRIEGTVVDWEQGRLAPRALVEAVALPDSLRYLAVADSTGHFALGAIPPGRYLLRAGVDANNDRRLQPTEPMDSASVQVDSTLQHTFWAFTHDTVGPALARVSLADSQTVRLEASQALPPGPLPPGSVQVLSLPDSTPLAVTMVWHLPAYDSLLAAQRPAGERSPSAGAARPASADTAPRAPADTSRAAQLLRQRPRLSNTLVVRLERALAPGSRYLVLADLANLTGARRRSRQVLVLPPRSPQPARP